jgi:hypothetical protein
MIGGDAIISPSLGLVNPATNPNPNWELGEMAAGVAAEVSAGVSSLGGMASFEMQVFVFRQKFTLEDAIEFHTFAPLDALACV